MNDTIKEPLKQGPTPSFSTHFTQCRPARRCKDHQKCRTCRDIWKKANLNKLTGHLTGTDAGRYKRSYYITINPTTLEHAHGLDIAESSSNLDLFIKGLITGKRAASSFLNSSEYIFMKEISYSKELGYYPHWNLILLTNHKLETMTLKGYRLHVTPISRSLDKDHAKAEYNHKNPLIQNIKNIIAYSLKTDNKRIGLERTTQLSKGKRDVYASQLFTTVKAKKQRKFSIHIDLIRAARKAARTAREHALRLHSCYKVLNPKASDIAIHRHALKTRSKIERIERTTQRKIDKLKAAQPPRSRKNPVHTTQ